MNTFPSASLIQEAASSARDGAGIPASFVEKDWFVTELLRLVSRYDAGTGMQILFSGGTSLSKGRNVIERFSEDVDFQVVTQEGQSLNRTARRNFRNRFLTYIKSWSPFKIAKDKNDREKIISTNEGRSIKVELIYPKILPQTHESVLRPIILMDLVFIEGTASFESLPIQSIIDEIAQHEPGFSIPCRDAVAIAGDKLSALTWRTLAEVQGIGKDYEHRTIIRHLHDLAALSVYLNDNLDAFAQEVTRAMTIDKGENRGQGVLSGYSTHVEHYLKLLSILQGDQKYAERYAAYVESMSYALPKQRIGFELAVTKLSQLIERLNQIL